MDANDNKDKVIEQIRKVMRLVNGAATEGEKSAAEAAAKRLAEKHGINLDDVTAGDHEIVTRVVSDGVVYRNIATIIPYATSVLHEHFGVIPVVCRMRGTSDRTIRWVGTQINIAIAQHVFHILCREFEKDWAEARLVKRYAKTLAADRTGYVDPKRQKQLVALTKVSRSAYMDGWFYSIHERLARFPLRNDIDQLEAEKKAAQAMIEKMKQAEDIKDKTLSKELSEDELLAAEMGLKAGGKVVLNRTAGGVPDNHAMLGQS